MGLQLEAPLCQVYPANVVDLSFTAYTVPHHNVSHKDAGTFRLPAVVSSGFVPKTPKPDIQRPSHGVNGCR